ncbi:hypothetical protein ACET3X_001479 [Alternaria dauci]|uniref:Zn(2)-C6 fungal-type domain-containing protein n=1 Tax=Alternaria dauci TaxID=48095 RepID=A0ABR3UXU0_9PLEO
MPPPNRLSIRKRVALACAPCRSRKTRCDGLRPSCSTCLELSLQCQYQRLPSPQRKNPTYAQLAKRVKELESQLLLTSAPSAPSLESGNEELNSHDESAVDLLATNAFDESPQQDIGYFGPTSNHALFRILTSALTQRLPILCRSPRQNIAVSSSRFLNQQQLDASKQHLKPSLQHMLTNQEHKGHLVSSSDQDLQSLVNHFFEAQGSVFPYVDRTVLGLGEDRSFLVPFENSSNTKKALLNIIGAHAALTKSSPDAEIFYRRTLVLLDGLPLRGSGLEFVQAVLLLCTFQQNTQRSIASWTYHAIAVKASFQMGLHALTLYDGKDPGHCEILQRVWLGVIIQDSALSMALGRPRLIFPPHARIPHRQMSLLGHTNSAIYFYQLAELTKVRASILEAIEDHHFGSSQSITIQEILPQRLQHICTLEQWKRTLPPASALATYAEVALWSPPLFSSNRFRILLTIHYHVTVLLINRPVLEAIAGRELGDDQFHWCTGEILLALQNDFASATELVDMISYIAKTCPGFFDNNAIWWTCNYYVFTAALHLFAILLASCQSDSTVLDRLPDSLEIRKAVVSSLQTLETIERCSLMSRKGRQCLQKFLHVLETFVLHAASAPNDILYNDPMLTGTFDDILAQFVAEPACDFVLQSSQLGYLDSDMGFLSSSLSG